MIQILAVIVLAVGVYTVAPSAETAQFFKLDSPADVAAVEVVKETTPTKERPTAALTASKEKRPKPPSPKPEPSQCRDDQWVRADNGECIDKPKVEAPSEPVAQVEATPHVPVTYSSGGSGSCDLANNYDWDARLARAICMAESGGNPNASNLNDYHPWAGCRGSFGLMQINCSHGQLYDGNANMRVAYNMWKAGGGFNAWGAYTDGSYLKYY